MILFICLILYCKIGVAVKIVITIHKFCTLNDMNGLSFRFFLTDGKVNRLLIETVRLSDRPGPTTFKNVSDGDRQSPSESIHKI